MTIHCCLNPKEKIQRSLFDHIYRVDFITSRGHYWAKRIAAESEEQATQKLKTKFPLAIVVRATIKEV